MSTAYAPIKGFYIELNLRKKKWLLCGSYKNAIDSHLDSLIGSLALYLSTCKNYIAIGDFNVEVDSIAMPDFYNAFDLVSLKSQRVTRILKNHLALTLY